MDKYGYDEAEAITEALENNEELPTQLYVDCQEISGWWNRMSDDDKEEAVSDYLSNEYGFCHNGFKCEETNGVIHITNIEWDTED